MHKLRQKTGAARKTTSSRQPPSLQSPSPYIFSTPCFVLCKSKQIVTLFLLGRRTSQLRNESNQYTSPARNMLTQFLIGISIVSALVAGVGAFAQSYSNAAMASEPGRLLAPGRVHSAPSLVLSSPQRCDHFASRREEIPGRFFSHPAQKAQKLKKLKRLSLNSISSSC